MNFNSIFWGILLIISGCFFAVWDFTGWQIGSFFWPLVFISAGFLLLAKRQLMSKSKSEEE